MAPAARPPRVSFFVTPPPPPPSTTLLNCPTRTTHTHNKTNNNKSKQTNNKSNQNNTKQIKIPHYHLEEATKAAKEVMGPYYREPAKSKGLFPTHLVEPLVKSFETDHYVENEGDIVFYKQDPALAGKVASA